jgi:PAS domain S-box-containing protein
MGAAGAVVIEALGLLLRATPDALDRAIEAVLGKLGAQADAHRAHLFIRTGGRWACTHEWCADGVASSLRDPSALLDSAHPVTTGACSAENVLSIASVDHLPQGAQRSALQERGVRSLVLVPLSTEPTIDGAMGLERISGEAAFTEQDIWLMRTLSDGLAASLARRDAEMRLNTVRAQQSETLDRLRATLAAMPELVLEIDEDGRCIEYHCSAPHLLARPPAEILGHTLEETLPAPIARLQRAGMAAARRDGTAHLAPYPLDDGDRQRWYALTIATRDRIAGREGFVFRIRDVTQEHARDAENMLLVQVTRRMTNLAMVLDTDQRIRWVNPALEARTGFALDELRGHHPSEFLDPTSDPAEVARIAQALTDRVPCKAEICKHDRHGTRYSVAVDVQTFARPDGTFEGFLVIETDITERKKHESALKHLAAEAEAARQQLQQAISAMPDAFAIFDADDRLVMCNRKYQSSLPRTAPVIVPGVTFEEILDAALERGDFPDATGQEAAWKAQRLAFHSRAAGEVELRLNTGRWVRAYERITPGGGRVALRIDISALKLAEQRLNEIIDGAAIGTWEFDVATQSATLNEQWAAMLGLGPRNLTRLSAANWAQFIHPDDAHGISAAMRAVSTGESPRIEAEIRMRHQDGHWVHVLARGRVTSQDATGRPLRVSGVGLDLTERRHAEERLHTILAASSIGTWQFNAESGTTLCDEQYAGMLGYTLAELAPWTHAKFESMVHPDDLKHMRKALAALYGTNQTDISHEFRMRHRDGRWIWILSQTRVQRWITPGIPAEESGVHIDITERKTREAALAEATHALECALAAQQESDQRFADIAAVSDEWFWEIDDESRIVYLSSGFERITGLSVDQLHGRTLEAVGFSAGSALSQGDWPELARQVEQRAKLSDFLFRLVIGNQRPPIWLRISGAPIFDTDGRYAGYRGVGSNVSELIGATERAETANQAKSRFLATMSHELRTPLTGVLGMADLLSETTVTAQQREMIDTIRDSGEGLLAIVNDVLDLAKIEAGKMTVDCQAFVPADLLRRVHALHAPRAQAAGLTLALDMSPDCNRPCLGDINRLQQVLNNLLGNAVKFTLQGGVTVRGRIAASPGGDTLEIAVEDTGIGMSAEQSAKVFEEFEQAEGSIARRFGGTGLGLSITRHLVGLMDGEISLSSIPGQGTQVRITLPIGTAPGTRSVAAPLADVPQRNLSGLRVLVADDNRANRRILETLLGKLEMAVTLAEDGHEAQRLYEPGAFDLLMLDISMPGLDGIGALAAIRQTEQQAGIPPTPALAVTANALHHQIEEYLAAGFAGHIAKPFRKEAFTETIARFCRPAA